jgi:superfamily II DNA or RNA helicase
MTSETLYLPGTEVELRGLRWEVVTSTPMGDQTLVRLRGTGGAFGGSEVDVLTPFEEVRPVVHQIDPTRPTHLANWLVFHQAFLLEQALGPNALLAVTPGRLRIEPYQLVPVSRCLRMPRPRLLLADDVGLGKTIEAGLIVTELIARRRANRILIVTPAGPLLDQWKEEMAQRFGLRLVVADRAELERIRKGTELGTNPFDHLPLALASMDYLKQDRVLDWLDRSNGYDLVILDEAHHYSDTGAEEYDRADASQRRKLALVLARAADALLLLSATPHDGHDRSFASLLELLDPSLTDGRGRVRDKVYRDFVVRRLKRHVRITHPKTNQPVEFPERQVQPVPVVMDVDKHSNFLAAQRELLAFVAPELRRAMRSRRYDDALAYLALLKRSVSTAYALHSTVRKVRDRFQSLAHEAVEEADARRNRIRTLKAIQRKAAKFGVLTPAEEEEREMMEVEDLAQQLNFLTREERGRRREADQAENLAESLSRVVDLACRCLDADPKLDALVGCIKAIRKDEPSANILVYTEYADSLRKVQERLNAEKVGTVLRLQGSDDEPTRKNTTALFRQHDRVLLVATDAASEGLNLHERCHHLLHLELPWNPNRLEQRNGRIDRYGQWQTPIVRYLYLKGTFEERVLARLWAKYERQRSKLRFVPNTLGLGQLEMPDENVLERLCQVMPEVQTDRPAFTFVTQEDQPDDPDVQALLQEIDASLNRFEATAKSYHWLAEEGLHATDLDRREAESARQAGQKAGAVDLTRFVQDAVVVEATEGGACQTNAYGFDLRLPDTWRHGLEELPGWDAERGRMRITKDLAVLATDKNEPIGFLGRAHPLVQRAIDRVRHLALGQKEGIDRRVSAAYAQDGRPAVVFTFLGRQHGRAGREMEQVLGVRVGPDLLPAVLENTADWLPEADATAPSRGMWDRHFAAWGPQGQEKAGEAARAAFQKVAERFARDHQRLLDEEQRRLDDWLKGRADEVCGPVKDEGPTLFDTIAPAEPRTAFERLQQFFSRQQSGSKARAEAESVLRFYERRRGQLQERGELRAPEVVPLGMLMLVPRGG